MKKSESMVKTDAGEIRVFRGRSSIGRPTPMHIGFLTMEPNSLLIPHYIDANLILFLRRGEAKIGWIEKDELVNRQLKRGDVLRIPAGSAFYLVNTGKGQRLQIISSIDPVDTGKDPYQSFFIGDGGENSRSVLAGFDVSTLTSAFNATPEEVGVLTSAGGAGPIVFLTGKDSDNHHRLTVAVRSAMKESKQRRLLQQDDDEEKDMEGKEENKKGASAWASILSSIFFGEAAEENKALRSSGEPVKVPDAYNLYDRDPDFKNRYGWSIELNKHDYLPLKKSDISVYLVNLTAGSMMAPHVNPRATEYGVVIAGEGTVEVVNPNGSGAMKAKVREGDVFWVPRFFPFCQMASREGPMEIVGFTTSSRRNRAQFLAGKSSILRVMMGKELAAGFGVREDELRPVVMRQEESAILPSWAEAEEEEKRVGKELI